MPRPRHEPPSPPLVIAPPDRHADPETCDGESQHAADRSTAARAGIYVDVENLPDVETAQRIIAIVATRWPDHHPPVGTLSLYVPADKARLWELWSDTEFPCLKRRVHGVQRFTRQASKNAADMAIAVDAIHDYVTGDVGHVAVVSNDSDFAALFAKIRELAAAARKPPPFLWITTGNGAGISLDMHRFVEGNMRWNIDIPPKSPAPASPKAEPQPRQPTASKSPKRKPTTPDNAAIADRLVAELPPGTFKAQQAMEIIKQHWPQHSAAQSTQLCGHFLARELWPFLKARRVKQVRQTSPRTYEVVPQAKPPNQA